MTSTSNACSGRISKLTSSQRKKARAAIPESDHMFKITQKTPRSVIFELLSSEADVVEETATVIINSAIGTEPGQERWLSYVDRYVSQEVTDPELQVRLTKPVFLKR